MIYEYKCEQCDKVEDRIVSSSTQNEQKCKICDDAKMNRVDKIHATSFALKGQWYKTTKSY